MNFVRRFGFVRQIKPDGVSMQMGEFGVWAVAGSGASGAMWLLWFWAARRNDASVVDVGWSAGVGAIAIWMAVNGSGAAGRRWIVGALGSAWALRLAGYLLVNRVWGKNEDRRYQTLRKRWGERANRNFAFVFQIQAAFVLLFALPFWGAAENANSTGSWSDLIGILIWVGSVTGEMIADFQLARFRARPENRGRTCRQGLWRYSRHPNYFFEWLHWWTYVLFGIGSPRFWATLVGPVAMLLFLLKITGIPATERQAVASRGDDYREYQRTTSAFIPWFPRS